MKNLKYYSIYEAISILEEAKRNDNYFNKNNLIGNITEQIKIVGESLDTYTAFFERTLRNKIIILLAYTWYICFTCFELFNIFFFEGSIFIWAIHMCAFGLWAWLLPLFHFDTKYFLYEYTLYLKKEKPKKD